MSANLVSFMLEYKFIFLFYFAIIIFLLFKRKEITTQARILILYRMKVGLNWMDKYSAKYRELIILKNLYDLLITPAAVSGVSLVLPGLNVPGVGILPFWYWLIALFVIAIVHEFSHGIVARAHQIPVKSTGLVFLGPIIGAFVEPDEKKMAKESDVAQYSVLAAGPFSNIILALIALMLLNFAFVPLQDLMTNPTGFTFDAHINESYPFSKAGIIPGTLITGINGEKTSTFQQFGEKLLCTQAEEKITINTPEKDYLVALVDSPDNPGHGFLGINLIHNEFAVKEKYTAGFWNVVYILVEWFAGLFKWLFLLSLGIGLFNLLPLPIVDGGRIMQVSLHRLNGPEKGEKRYRQISFFFLIVLILTLLYPLLVKLLL